MGKKDFLLELGERSVAPMNTDALLQSKIAERKRKEIERQEEIDEAKHEADLAKLRKQTKTADVAVEKTEGKAETGFKVTGGVNLGNIDLDADRKQAALELKELKKEQDETIRAVGRENEQLRDKIHEKEIEVLRTSFQAQMELLTKAIEGNASRGSFADQLNAARAIAAELGYAQPSSAGGDLITQLKLKEMEFNQARELRRLSREEKESDRRWQLELRRMDEEREAKKVEQAREAKKDEMFAKAPEVIGRTIGRAMLESGGGVAEQAEAPVSAKARGPVIEAPVGEAGETTCMTPNCGKPVAVGPTAKVAVCASCGARYPIRRVKTEATEPQPETAGAPVEEEEE